ncbi:hypothetical protein CXG81DRAFT_8477 [Caulochytrium protostelioides]|uniref:Protein farnesyltransferase subunit beta n=1 Tax=Caulochytrium protostelioides TaxID=1555241 RepID=A0A4P9XFG1_9FUNG|nr:hypothetical protein CXG81DRAFT_8477 [Caulochytrium protostelioides]|eukprot:RKP04312.1 hypothetical protein CXG81DRAFT_8477 [Caulochytrium protostelioides]
MDLERWLQPDDDFATDTSELQAEVEDSVFPLLEAFATLPQDQKYGIQLLREPHVRFLEARLDGLSRHFVSLDASKPWFIYWIFHALDLLDVPIPAAVQQRAIETLRQCQSPLGGFGGGPGQMPHTATTYAAVNALVIIGTPEAYALIDQPRLLGFLQSMKQPSGAYRVHDGGEIDVRGVYCALAVAKLLDLPLDELTENVADWVAACQTYEGGIASAPHLEAHGGYTFCGLAALELLGAADKLDLPALADWLVQRQMAFSGGFCGRTNKLVDACYAWWQGATAPLLAGILAPRAAAAAPPKPPASTEAADEDEDEDASPFVSALDLQIYLLVCCQSPQGGMIDKPGKTPDFYHTCYALSGLSAAQHRYRRTGPGATTTWSARPAPASQILGGPGNLLQPTHPVFNLRFDRIAHFLTYAAC